MMEKQRKYYAGITVFKFLGALSVMLFHVTFPDFNKELNEKITGFDRFTNVVIPCFYITAGFLAFNGWSNAGNSKQYVKRYLGWILAIYSAATAIFLITRVIPRIVSAGVGSTVLLTELKRLFVAIFIIGPLPTFWFIPPLLLGVAFSYYFDRYAKLKVAGMIALAAFLIAQVFNGSLRPLFEHVIGNPDLDRFAYSDILKRLLSNYWGRGAIFVVLGALLAKHVNWCINLNSRKLAFAVILFAATEMFLLNYFIGGKYPYRLVLSMLPLSAWLFYGLLHIKSDRIKVHHKVINTFSNTAYFTHMLFIKFNAHIFGWNKSHLMDMQSLLTVLLTFAECALLTYFIIHLSKRYSVKATYQNKNSSYLT